LECTRRAVAGDRPETLVCRPGSSAGRGKNYCAKKDAEAFSNLKLPLQDTDGRNVGILVMEIPFTSVVDEAAAIRPAESIRRELALRIPSHNALFQ